MAAKKSENALIKYFGASSSFSVDSPTCLTITGASATVCKFTRRQTFTTERQMPILLKNGGDNYELFTSFSTQLILFTPLLSIFFPQPRSHAGALAGRSSNNCSLSSSKRLHSNAEASSIASGMASRVTRQFWNPDLRGYKSELRSGNRRGEV